MLLTENHDSSTRQIINFASRVSFCFPFEIQLPQATIFHSKMQNVQERGKKDYLIACLSGDRF